MNENSSNNSAAPQCKCGKPSVKRKVFKEGPNQGRYFYSCENKGCNFFKWCGNENDENKSIFQFRPPNSSSSNVNNNSSNNNHTFKPFKTAFQRITGNSSSSITTFSTSSNPSAKSNDDNNDFNFALPSLPTNDNNSINNIPKNKPKPSIIINNNNNSQNSIKPNNRDIPKCKHGEDCSLHRVKKDGKTKGKLFWSCPNFEDKCNIFIWFNGNEKNYEDLIDAKFTKQSNKKDKTDTSQNLKSDNKIELELCSLERITSLRSASQSSSFRERAFQEDKIEEEEETPSISTFCNINTTNNKATNTLNTSMDTIVESEIVLKVVISNSFSKKVKYELSNFGLIKEGSELTNDDYLGGITNNEEKKNSKESQKTALYYAYSDYSEILEKLKESFPNNPLVEIPTFIRDLINKYERLEKENCKLNVWEKLPHKLIDSLLDYQKQGIEFGIKRNGRVLIADEMGLGKTCQAIAIATYFSCEWPMWIVCPSSLKANWKKEILKWIGGIEINVKNKKEVMVSDKIKIIDKGKEINDHSLVNIISYDMLAKEKILKIVQDLVITGNCGVIICDESHLLKNTSSKRSQSIMPLLEECKRIILTSGTSCTSYPIELYSSIKVLIKDKSLKKVDFGFRYCGLKTQPRSAADYKGFSRLSELFCLLSNTIMIRRLKRDVLSELPPKKRTVNYIDISDSDAKKFEKSESNNSSIKTFGNNWKKLQQDKELLAKYKLTGEAKIKGITDYVKKMILRKEKFLVFAHHLSVLDAIEKTVTEELQNLSNRESKTVSDDILDLDILDSRSSSQTYILEEVDEFTTQEPYDYIRIDGSTLPKDREDLAQHFRSNERCLAAVLSMTVAGTGLNLVPCSIVIFAELSWNPALLNQCEDRCHRIGQQCVFVDIRYLLAKKTLDDYMWKVLSRKVDVISESLNGKREEKQEHLIKSAESTTPSPNTRKKSLQLIPGQSTLDKMVVVHNIADDIEEEEKTPPKKKEEEKTTLPPKKKKSTTPSPKTKSEENKRKRDDKSSTNNSNNSNKATSTETKKQKKQTTPPQKNTLLTYFKQVQ
ncbi:hypothetical protein ABK040_012873 [Willaertia magna]